jgi:hypothetical protein
MLILAFLPNSYGIMSGFTGFTEWEMYVTTIPSNLSRMKVGESGSDQAINLRFNENQPKNSRFEGLNGHFKRII